jgi:four helix bundle protein
MAWQSFEEIEAWQTARILNHRIWAVIESGVMSKDRPLADQINRAAGSAMDNIAEGFDGGSNAEFAKFLTYTQRSCSEVRSQLYRALDRGHIDQATFDILSTLALETHRKSGGLIKHLRSR